MIRVLYCVMVFSSYSAFICHVGDLFFFFLLFFLCFFSLFLLLLFFLNTIVPVREMSPEFFKLFFTFTSRQFIAYVSSR